MSSVYPICIECPHSLEETCQRIQDLHTDAFESEGYVVQIDPLHDRRQTFMLRKISLGKTSSSMQGVLEKQADGSTLVHARHTSISYAPILLFTVSVVAYSIFRFFSATLSGQDDGAVSATFCCIGFFFAFLSLLAIDGAEDLQKPIEGDLRRALAR